MDIFFALILGSIALGGALCILWLPRVFFMSRRCRSNYRRWLEENNLTEVSREDRLFFKGPFFGKAGAESVVFRGEFRDVAGVVRKGFLRCGDHHRGLLGHHVLDVKWDD